MGFLAYAGTWFASPSETDRRRFASNLLNLTLAGPRVHGYQKIDHDGAVAFGAEPLLVRVAARQQYGFEHRTGVKRTRWTRC